MEEITATVRQNADTAPRAGELAGGASAVAARGGDIVGRVVSTMDGITRSSRPGPWPSSSLPEHA